ncbi:MAG TPA: BON domain-containing protein [Candidatus Polarisedimenticolia bacterium]|nr:BON domain-containing protein [Candidatus Polarisedimenticolia bacterium]
MRRAPAWLLFLGFTLPSLSFAIASSPGDARIVDAVESALMASGDSGVRGLRVRCEAGILTLGGTADTLSTLDMAHREAARVPGVLDVVVTAVVSRRGIPNAQVLADVRQALGRMDSASGSIQATVGSGRVMLQGVTGTFEQKMMAEKEVSKIPGVSGIQNEIRIGSETNARAHELTRRILSQLRSGPSAIPGRFEVTMKGRTAILKGRVPLYLHRIEAGEAVLSVPGVSSVDNRLVVDPGLVQPASDSKPD